MHTISTTPQVEAQLAAADLQEGLFVLELEERLELATLAAAAASCQRCDISTSEV